MMDFQASDPKARDAETLNLFATIMKQDGNNLASFLNQILVNLCQPTLSMISNEFREFPEFREGFFGLIQNIITCCTQGLFDLDSNAFDTII